MKRHKLYTVGLIILFIIAFAWGVRANADELRLGVGFGVTHDNDWTTQELTYLHRNWYGQAAYMGGDNRLPDTYRLSAGYRVHWRPEKRFSPFMRLGVAYFGERPLEVISDRLAFDMAVGVRAWGVVELEWQHNSTAGRSDINYGNDVVLLGMVFPIR